MGGVTPLIGNQRIRIEGEIGELREWLRKELITMVESGVDVAMGRMITRFGC